MPACANPWLERRVIAYAHQGGAWEAPSSTLFAIERALEAGADAIELDVHATADGELVVCHDATVDRTTDGHGAHRRPDPGRAEGPRQRLLVHPRGRRHPRAGPRPTTPTAAGRPRTPSFRIATLREVLEAFPGVVLNLDIKQTAPVVAPYEAALAGLLAEFGRTDDVIVASFLDPATDAFSAVAPDVPTSAGTLATAEFWRAVHDGTELPAPARRGLPGARASGGPRRGGRGLRRGGPRGAASPSTCGRSTTPRPWSGWSTSGWTASSPTCRHAGRGARPTGRRLGRPVAA